jgi:crossover junction endodeoxyribonuclease RuvC
MAITGNGMPVRARLPKCYSNFWDFEELPKIWIVLMVCHFNSGKVVGTKSYTGWDAFVQQNQDKIR